MTYAQAAAHAKGFLSNLGPDIEHNTDMRKRSSEKKADTPTDLTAALASAVGAVVETVKNVVADPVPLDGLPPADIVSEVPLAPPSRTKSLPAKNPAAVAVGKPGGVNGNAARAKKLKAEQRREIVRRAVRNSAAP